MDFVATLKLCFLYRPKESEKVFLMNTKEVKFQRILSKNLKQRWKLGTLKTPFANLYAYKMCRNSYLKPKSVENSKCESR